MKINFLSNKFKKYVLGCSTLYIDGTVFVEDKSISPFDIIEGLDSKGSEFLGNLNGFYAFVYISEKLSIACVDIIRSIPLFYSVNESESCIDISDNTICLKEGKSINSINKEIFQLCSYVVGNETLYNGINQILSGSYLQILRNQTKILYYFKYQALEPQVFDKRKFKSDVDRAIELSFRRLMEYAGGKQIIVPLSGGYDSRLIISSLKKLNYENVICFSYGVEGNIEAEYSRKIAESLNFKWIFIEYTSNKWKDAWNTQLSEDYLSFASNDSSLPHIQDWLAVKEMKDRKLVEEDGIFVPGHCCVTSYITKDILLKRSKSESLSAICNRHFSISPISETREILNFKRLKSIVEDKVKDQIDLIHDTPNSVTMYNWQERQSKYIANSVRTYDFFGFDWWLPLWDKDFVNTWGNLPNPERVNRKLFKEIVAKIYSEVSGNEMDLGNASKPSFRYYIAQNITKLMPVNLKTFFKSFYRKNEYLNHPLELGSIVSKEELMNLTSKGYKITGIYSKMFLKGFY